MANPVNIDFNFIFTICTTFYPDSKYDYLFGHLKTSKKKALLLKFLDTLNYVICNL